MPLTDIELVYAENNNFTLVEECQEQPATEGILISLPGLVKLQQMQKTDLPGLLLETDEDVGVICSLISKLPVIAIRFQTFTDGRGFSQARLLRERYGYTGKLQALGDFLPDQMHYLTRCGFDNFILPDGTDLETAENCLKAFSEAYQTSCDQPQPLFRRSTKLSS